MVHPQNVQLHNVWNWAFGKWTFSILDVLYPGRSVTGRLETGCFVTRRSVIGRFVSVPFNRTPFYCYS